MTNRLRDDQPQIFSSLAALQDVITDHVKAVRVEQARRFRELSDEHYAKSLHAMDASEQAQLEGMGEAFAIAAAMVDVKMLEAVP